MFVLEYFIAHIPLIICISAFVGLVIAWLIGYVLHAICGD